MNNKPFKGNQSGSFTIEASLLFPILLILTISLIFFSLVIYQKAVLYQRAHLIADRMAYTWDNSHKNIENGAFSRSDYTTDLNNGDGLYWRLTSNKFLEKFGLDLDLGGGGLIREKISRSSNDLLPGGTDRQIRFVNDLTGGKIVVTLESPLRFPAFIEKLFGIQEVTARASADVTEPTEFIRTTDLVVTYVKQLINICNGNTQDPIQVNCNRAVGRFK
ncbi:MAG TPA: TadE/TadG family type IV pilus assembly protein [Bacillales bacterium]|nr:TadE/TadG family type IV pilus assembly protein [Bacillales bacterium]